MLEIKPILAFFQRFFDHTLLRPIGHAPIFCQMKGLMKIHNRGKFNQGSICGSQVLKLVIFKCFRGNPAAMKWTLFWWWWGAGGQGDRGAGDGGGFLALFPPSYGSNLLNFD